MGTDPALAVTIDDTLSADIDAFIDDPDPDTDLHLDPDAPPTDLLLDSDDDDDHAFLHRVKVREFTNAHQVFYTGAALQICLAMEGLLLAPHLSDIAADFGLDARERDLNLGGLLSLVILLVSLPASAAIGYFGDTRDRKAVIFGLALLGAAANTLVAVVPSFPLFVALRCLSAVSAMSNMAFVSLIAEMYSHRERSVILGNYNAVRGTGVGLGVVLSTALSRASWRVSFVLVGILSFAAAMLFAVVYTKCEMRVPAKATKRTPVRPTTLREAVPLMFHSGVNVALFLQAPFSTLPIDFIGVYMIDWFFKDAGAPSKFAALVVAASFAIGLVLGQANAAACTRCLGDSLTGDRRLTLVTTAALYTLPIVPLALVWSSSFSFWLMLPCVGAGFAAGVNMTLTRTLLLNSNPGHVHTSLYAIFCTLESVGKGVGLMVLSYCMAHGDRGVILAASSSVWLVCAFVLLVASSFYSSKLA